MRLFVSVNFNDETILCLISPIFGIVPDIVFAVVSRGTVPLLTTVPVPCCYFVMNETAMAFRPRWMPRTGPIFCRVIVAWG